jgi:hypothetical protein
MWQSYEQYCHSEQHYSEKVPEAGPATNFKVVAGGQETD